MPGSYQFNLYRRGAPAPSIPILGTKAGVFAVEIRAQDRAGRLRTIKHCWDHQPLAAPLDVRAAVAATHGPIGSGKYALSLLKLEDTTSPIDPIGREVLSDPSPATAPFGTGLMQFPVYNATTEPVYFTIDLTKPVGARYTKTVVTGKTTVDSIAGSADCGPATVDPFGNVLDPDPTLPWCTVGFPASVPGTTTVVPAPPLGGDAETSPTYGVRVWEEVTANNFVELTANCPAPGCNQTAPDSARQRLTVLLPARLPPNLIGDPRPQRTFWVMPVVQTLTDLGPDTSGPFTEFSAGGVTLSGELLSVPVLRCGAQLSTLNGRWRCTAKRTATSFNALKAATFKPYNDVVTLINAAFAVSLDGASPSAPPYVVSVTRAFSFGQWSTAEPTGL